MIDVSEYFFPSSDGSTSIHVTEWKPTEKQIRGIIQIAHGVAEYGQRYDAFARFLCIHGFVVVANDHLGHGQSIHPHYPRLYFGEQNGWWYAVDDLEILRQKITQKFLGKPIFLFGHSMGSFLSRSHLIRFAGKLDGCILCGTGHPSALTILGGKLVSHIESKRIGKQAFSQKVDQLAFGSYNKKFVPNRTNFDWLSVNQKNVDAYISDPLCGGNTCLGLFCDLLVGLSYITKQKHIKQMEKTQPILFISGSHDPVGNMGVGVKKAYHHFQSAGLQNVTMKLYPNLRHELLHEENQEEIYQDILHWLKKQIKKGE